MNASDDMAELHDPEISVEEIMRDIHNRVETRRQKVQAQGEGHFESVEEPGVSQAIGAEVTGVASQLRQLIQSADTLRLAPIITDWRIPLVNPLLRRLKKMLHELVLLYVNMLAGHQMAVNRSLARSLLVLIGARQADAARLLALEKEVALLRERVIPSE